MSELPTENLSADKGIKKFQISTEKIDPLIVPIAREIIVQIAEEINDLILMIAHETIRDAVPKPTRRSELLPVTAIGVGGRGVEIVAIRLAYPKSALTVIEPNKEVLDISKDALVDLEKDFIGGLGKRTLNTKDNITYVEDIINPQGTPEHQHLIIGLGLDPTIVYQGGIEKNIIPKLVVGGVCVISKKTDMGMKELTKHIQGLEDAGSIRVLLSRRVYSDNLDDKYLIAFQKIK